MRTRLTQTCQKLPGTRIWRAQAAALPGTAAALYLDLEHGQQLSNNLLAALSTMTMSATAAGGDDRLGLASPAAAPDYGDLLGGLHFRIAAMATAISRDAQACNTPGPQHLRRALSSTAK